MPYEARRGIELIKYSSDAYYAHYTDKDFAKGIADIDGTVRQWYDRASWLRDKSYQLIENPAGQTNLSRYFGITTNNVDGVVFIAFRGTTFNNFHDVTVDARGAGFVTNEAWLSTSFPMVPWRPAESRGDQSEVLVHKNFLQTYLFFRSAVHKLVLDYYRDASESGWLFVTGHSLGGALATICALDIGAALSDNEALGVHVPQPVLYTFGSPRVGDEKFTTKVRVHTVFDYRVHHRGDPVPRVPAKGWVLQRVEPSPSWRPEWLDWFYLGHTGETKWVDFDHAGMNVVVGSPGIAAKYHLLTNYYQECLQLTPEFRYEPKPSGLKPTDPIQSLMVRIKTADAWGAGTNNDVFIHLLDTKWGPLDHWGNDFEAGSTGEYDLFAMFPEEAKGKNWKVQDLTEVGLRLGDGWPDHYSVWSAAWLPEWVDIHVNGQKLLRKKFQLWLDNWLNFTYVLGIGKDEL